MKKAYVIGAGPLGLSVAIELVNNGYQVIVIDSLPEVGGLTRTFNFSGDLVEFYYHFFYWGDHHIASEFLSLLDEDIQIQWRDISTKNYVDGKFVDFDSPLSLFKIAGDGFAKLVFTLMRIKFFSINPKLDKVPAVSWARKAFGIKFFARVWYPLLQNKFWQYSDKVSALWLAVRIKRHMSTKVGKKGRCRFGYLTSTYQPFFEVLQERVIGSGGQFRLGSKLSEIVVNGNQVVRLETDTGGIEVEPGAKVFSTIPLGNLKDVGTISNHLQYLRDFHLIGAVLVILKLRRPLSDDYWTTVSDQSIPFDVIIQQNRLYQNSAHEIVYLSRYYSQTNSIFLTDSNHIVDSYLEGLMLMFPWLLKEDVIDKRLVRTKSAAPLPSIDMLSKIPPYKSTIDNFYHAGFENIYPEDRGVGNSIRIGKEMVSRFLKSV